MYNMLPSLSLSPFLAAGSPSAYNKTKLLDQTIYISPEQEEEEEGPLSLIMAFIKLIQLELRHPPPHKFPLCAVWAPHVESIVVVSYTLHHLFLTGIAFHTHKKKSKSILDDIFPFSSWQRGRRRRRRKVHTVPPAVT